MLLLFLLWSFSLLLFVVVGFVVVVIVDVFVVVFIVVLFLLLFCCWFCWCFCCWCFYCWFFVVVFVFAVFVVIFVVVFVDVVVVVCGGVAAQSVWRLATGWTVRNLNPDRTRFPAPVQTCPAAHPASYTTGTGSFLGVKRLGRGVDHQSPFSAEVQERADIYFYSKALTSWLVSGSSLYLFTIPSYSTGHTGVLISP